MNMNRIFTTDKGTELPLLNLKGRDYLEVKYRLVWFREEHPQWSIETEFLNVDERSALARAVVKDESGRVIATSHKAEAVNNFPDFMEKAETGAIGRALALIGFGTQFCADELDEGERIVDAPVAKKGKSDPGQDPTGKRAGLEKIKATDRTVDLGEFQVNFGKKYLGRRLKEIPRDEIESYLEWLDNNAAQKKSGPSYEVTILKEAVDRYYHPEKYGKLEKKGDGKDGDSGKNEQRRQAS